MDDIGSTLAIDLEDTKTTRTAILEVGEIARISSCSNCNGNLNDVIGAATLMLCEKCHRHVLKRNIQQHVSTTITLKHGTTTALINKCKPLSSTIFRKRQYYFVCQW
jgi:hypothetical protein